MSTLFERGMNFNNSKVGILLLSVLSVCVFVLPITFLIRKGNDLQALEIACCIITFGVSVFGMITAFSRAKRLKSRNV